MQSFRVILMSVCLIALLIGPNPSPAHASGSCSSVVSGARTGPSPNWDQWPYGDACYVEWPGGHSAEREKYERDCRNLSGAEFVAFSGDYGSGRNTCIFKVSPQLGKGGASPPPQSCGDILKNAPGFSKFVVAEREKNWTDLQVAAGEVSLYLKGVGGTCGEQLTRISDSFSCYSMAALALSVETPSVELRDYLVEHCSKESAYYVQNAIRKAKAANAAPVTPRPQPTPTPAPADAGSPDDAWGALALTPNGSFFGWSSGKSSVAAARAEALESCTTYQNNTISTGYDTRQKCKVVVVIRNQCLSTAAHEGQWYWVGRDTKKEADEAALANCRQDHSTGCRRVPDAQFCSIKNANGAGGGSRDQQNKQKPITYNRPSVKICNTYPGDVRMALQYRKVNHPYDTLEGWTTISSNSCYDFGMMEADHFFYYAETLDRENVWSGDAVRHCLMQDTFTFWVDSNYKCRRSDESYGMKRVNIPSNRSSYTYKIGR